MTDDQLADLPHEPDVATVTDDKNVSVSIRCAEDVAQSGQYDDNDDHDTARPDGKRVIARQHAHREFQLFAFDSNLLATLSQPGSRQ